MSRWENSPFEHLVGKTIHRVLYDDQNIAFVLSSGETVYYSLSADCCSVTWFYQISGLTVLIGETVIEAVEVPIEHVDINDGLGRQDYDSAYGMGLRTSKGVFGVIFRNSSNGYYGGWIERWNTPILNLEFLTEDYLAQKREE